MNELRVLFFDEKGAATIEFVIWLPVILISAATLTAIWMLLWQVGELLRINYLVADHVSRQIDPIDDSVLLDIATLISDSNSPNQFKSFRVTVIKWNSDEDIYEVVWSKSVGKIDPLTTSTVGPIPVFNYDFSTIRVDTVFSVFRGTSPNFLPSEIKVKTFLEPRYVQELCWVECSN